MTLTKTISIVLFCTGLVHGATLDVRLDQAPSEGRIVCMLYNSANNFGDLRDPFRTERFPISRTNQYRLTDIPAGTYALVVFLDDNKNGFLDKNFIGIPREPIGFSKQYRPKGPASFERAKFTLGMAQTRTEVITLERVLGERGRIGVGVGLIGRSSPYREYDGNVSRVIPSVTYIGDRFQILGPSVRLGLLGSGKTRLAATLAYRIGVYEENDSPYLQGMGDREDTAMLGLAYQAELPGGLEGNLSFDHDILDEFGGSTAQLSVGKTFQRGIARLTPQIGVNWLSDKMSNYDFGVSARQARAGRTAYEPGAAWNPEIGLGTFLEVTRNWLIVGNLEVELLDKAIRKSPIVSEDHVLKVFFGVNYVF
ncbi:MAG: MipA/OmpV family protein [Phycisphaerae bacterium]|nr:MipA/OmpV family protein [Phycisphaerae bacterium]